MKKLIDKELYWVKTYDPSDPKPFICKYFGVDKEFCYLDDSGETVWIKPNLLHVIGVVTQPIKEGIHISEFLEIYNSLKRGIIPSFCGIHFDSEKYAEIFQLAFKQFDSCTDRKMRLKWIEFMRILPTRKIKRFFVNELYPKEEIVEHVPDEIVIFANYYAKLSEGYKKGHNIEKIYRDRKLAQLVDITSFASKSKEYCCRKCGNVQSYGIYCLNCGKDYYEQT